MLRSHGRRCTRGWFTYVALHRRLATIEVLTVSQEVDVEETSSGEAEGRVYLRAGCITYVCPSNSG